MKLFRKTQVGLCALMGTLNCFGAFSDLGDWTGVTVDENGESAMLAGKASYTYPDGEKGWYNRGLYSVHDGSGNWREQ